MGSCGPHGQFEDTLSEWLRAVNAGKRGCSVKPWKPAVASLKCHAHGCFQDKIGSQAYQPSCFFR